MHSTLNSDEHKDNQPTRGDEPAQPDTAGASTDVKAPFAPHEDDDSALGDTDQHSTA